MSEEWYGRLKKKDTSEDGRVKKERKGKEKGEAGKNKRKERNKRKD